MRKVAPASGGAVLQRSYLQALVSLSPMFETVPAYLRCKQRLAQCNLHQVYCNFDKGSCHECSQRIFVYVLIAFTKTNLILSHLFLKNVADLGQFFFLRIFKLRKHTCIMELLVFEYDHVKHDASAFLYALSLSLIFCSSTTRFQPAKPVFRKQSA